MPKTSNPLSKQRGLSINLMLTVIVVVAAVVVIGGVVLFNQRGNGDSGASTVSSELLRRQDSNVLATAPGSKVTIVEFLDYQCPACHAYYDGMLKQLEKDYQGKVTFVTRNFPLDMHPLARLAAQAAEAAALQGKYNQMYHALYDNWSAWAVTPDSNPSSDSQKAQALFDQYAQRIGLDMAKFHQDMNSQQIKAKIDRDVADGTKAGVSGTPTIFVNGQRFESNAQTYQQLNDEFRKKLDQELAK